MTSKLVVNTIEADTGISSVSFASSISMSSTSKFHFGDAGIDIGADTNINRPTAGALGFNINSSEKVRITSAGNVGIGTAVPEAASNYANLSLADTTGGQIELKRLSDDTKHYIWGNQDLNIGGGYANGASSSIRFYVNGANERLRITSDGKIGIGEDEPDGNYLLIRAASTVGTTKGHIMLTGDSATNGQGPQIVFSESGSGSNFAGAYIGHVRLGSNSIGDLVFGTRAISGDVNTVPTERLRITNTGRLKINHTQSQKLDDTWLSIYDANSDSSAIDPAGISKNYAMISLHNYGTGVPGDSTGIGFGAGSAFNYTKGSIAFQRQGSYGTGDLVFLTNNDQDTTMVNDTDEKMRITRDGKIGINKNSPSKELHVSGNAGAGIMIESSGTTNGGVLDLRNTQGSNQTYRLAVGGGDNAYVLGRGFFIRDDNNSATRFVINTNGRIGINELNPQQQLHVHNDTSYQGIFINGNGAPRLAFARSTTTTGEWSLGIDGTNGNDFAITQSNDNSQRKVIVSSSGLTAAGTITSGGNATFNGVVTFNGNYQQGNSTSGLAMYGSASMARGVVLSHGANNFRPTHTNDVDLGTSSIRWKQIYTNNSVNTSDKNLKNTISDSDLGLSFINKLRPVSYKWNQKEEENLDTKTHYGLIAQEIETALISEGKTLNDFAGVFKPDDYKDDGTGGAMGISLSEIISPLIKAIQELSAKVAALEGS